MNTGKDLILLDFIVKLTQLVVCFITNSIHCVRYLLVIFSIYT